MVLVAHSVSCARKFPAAWPYLPNTRDDGGKGHMWREKWCCVVVGAEGRGEGAGLVADGRKRAHEVSGRDKISLVLVSVCKQTVF
jgi:hypothetical protein